MKDGNRFGKSRSTGSYNKPAWNQGGNDQKPSHKAQCADCGNNCTVPFKPNGRKPVLCSDCFRVKGPSDSKPSYGGSGGGGSRGGSSYGDRGGSSYSDRSNDRRPSGPSLKDEIAAINKKLDRILTHLGE